MESHLRSIAVLGFVGLAVHAATLFGASRADEAVGLVQRAVVLQEEGRHEEALKLLNQAWTAAPHPKVLFYKGRSQIALGRFDDARMTYQLIQQSLQDLEEWKLAEVRKNLAMCEAELRQTSVRIETPGISGALVTINGEVVGATPLTRTLKRGVYRVHVEQRGYRASDLDVVINGEEQQVVSVPLALEGPSAGVEVPAAGPSTGATATPVVRGARVVRAPAPNPSRVLEWTLVGAGSAVALGGVAWLVSIPIREGRAPEGKTLSSDRTLDYALGGTLLGVGLGAATTGLVLLLQGSQTAPVVTALPLAGGGALLGVAGSF